MTLVTGCPSHCQVKLNCVTGHVCQWHSWLVVPVTCQVKLNCVMGPLEMVHWTHDSVNSKYYIRIRGPGPQFLPLLLFWVIKWCVMFQFGGHTLRRDYLALEAIDLPPFSPATPWDWRLEVKVAWYLPGFTDTHTYYKMINTGLRKTYHFKKVWDHESLILHWNIEN